jgi:hypothetical protein
VVLSCWRHILYCIVPYKCSDVLTSHGLAGSRAFRVLRNRAPRANSKIRSVICRFVVPSKRRPQPESTKAVHVAKRQVSGFAIPPKAHAVMEYIPQVVEGCGLDAGGFVLTVPGGPRAPDGPFQCAYLSGVNPGVALSVTTLIAAMMRKQNKEFTPPEKLLGLAGCVQATFEEVQDNWLSMCVQANYLGMAAARAGVQHMLHDNCQRSQVVMGLQGGDPFPQSTTPLPIPRHTATPPH